MKKIFVMMAAIVALMSCGSNAVVKSDICCDIENLELVETIYLVDMWDGRNVLDSVKIEGAKSFCFKGVKPSPTFARLMTEQKKLPRQKRLP